MENGSIYVGILSFILVSIYLFGYSYKLITKETVATEVVRNGTIGESNDYNGIIIRDEQIFKSTVEGTVTYYYSEGDRVKKNAVVCNIVDPKKAEIFQEQIEKKNNEINKVQESRGDISLVQEDINRTNSKIKNITNTYTVGTLEDRLNNLYTFKDKVEGEINLRTTQLIADNKGSAKAIIEERFKYDEQLRAITNEFNASESGIVSFSFDGYEDIFNIDKMETLTIEEIDMNIDEAERVSSNIEADKPIFRVIKSFEWYIASYIPNEVVNEWTVDDSKTLVFDDNKYSPLDVKIKTIIPKGEQKLVIFYTDRDILNYINTRSVRFKIEAEIYEGLKVPNTAIVEKTFLKVPSECIFQVSGQDAVTKVQDQVSIPVKISFKDETETFVYILQDFSSNSISLKINDQILKTNGEQYTITETTTKLGVYVVNRGTADLKTVEIVKSNDTHSIVKAVDNYDALKIYDSIISDAKSTKENDLIY